MKNLILIAPPAAGKGTISSYLVEHRGYTHISTGDILRNVAKEDSEMGRLVKGLMQEGKFIGDDIILPLFKEELLKQKEKPFILDGLPRTINQANYLTDLFQELNVDNYIVINLEIQKDVLLKRATGRRICESCKSTYNVYFEEFKPKKEGICDKCGCALIQRDDDTEDTFQARYETYLKETAPLIHYYESLKKLEKVDANLTEEEILKNVDRCLND